MIEELEHYIKQNKMQIASAARFVIAASEDLQEMVKSNNFDSLDSLNWIDGHVSENVTKLASLLQKHQTLQQALRIMKKGSQE